eukprot:scaffold452039_cov18-Prasinocladus_malaysianus.AAC.1
MSLNTSNGTVGCTVVCSYEYVQQGPCVFHDTTYKCSIKYEYEFSIRTLLNRKILIARTSMGSNAECRSALMIVIDIVSRRG